MNSFQTAEKAIVDSKPEALPPLRGRLLCFVRVAWVVLAFLALGVVLYVLLRSIPVLGWLIGLLATLVGLGAMWLLFDEARSVTEPRLDQEVGVD